MEKRGRNAGLRRSGEGSNQSSGKFTSRAFGITSLRSEIIDTIEVSNLLMSDEFSTNSEVKLDKYVKKTLW